LTQVNPICCYFNIKKKYHLEFFFNQTIFLRVNQVTSSQSPYGLNLITLAIYEHSFYVQEKTDPTHIIVLVNNII
jgi:hypothetical protein